MSFVFRCAGITTLIALIAWSAYIMMQPKIGDYASSPQSRDGRFHNPRPLGPGDMPESTLRVWWNFLFNKPAGTVPSSPVPIHRLSRAELDAAPDRSLYRLGHSTVLMKLRGQWWLTDPVFSERAAPVQFFGPKRFHAPPISIDELPPIRAVILSHDHYDHLDRAAIKALGEKAEVFLMPLGVGDRLADWGIAPDKIRQFDWWQGIKVDGLRLTVTPAQHFSGRSFSDGNRTLWASWVIQDDDYRLFFSGDSGYFKGFAEIGERFGPFDLTLMETGAYNEQWPYVHMLPSETVQAHQDLRGRWLLPIHNGTFDLGMHVWEDPFDQILHFAAERDVQVATPMMGERIDMDAPHAGRLWWREEAVTSSSAFPAAIAGQARP
ncbi:MBL fold metallo-hydrolase [Thauera sp. Sel9]|uniref:MBL fold metallo-hydrolase n=1 Tax=Thauera sp. Sel9 TaxID=2974299 RepID=UPI0021E1746C|nr:MBL fold metallo-hydrolase [Thauera sp. Sel9]MCV2217943.1 MBL fold metallo-hydrolase [Thauera sp. Sel9]